MEKAILKTLIYSDIFDHPLTIFEIHKWLIGRKAVLRQVEKSLNKSLGSKVESKGGYYFLPKRESLVSKRKQRAKQSLLYIRKVTLISYVLKLIPFIKLVGISGGLSMENAGKSDDIDLFVITSKNRMWLSRLFILGILSTLGQRRKASDTFKKAAGKICCNVILEEDCLEQRRKNIYTAHEVLQMKVLWQRAGIYSKYLSDNEWAFKFLPNWVGGDFSKPPKLASKSLSPIATLLENLSKQLQLKVMKSPQGMERIEEGALYFHPQDYGPLILEKYTNRVQEIINS